MIKRLFDFFASLLGLLFLFPIFLIIAILIKLDSKGPVFFRQVRAGLDGKSFRIHKFRTMRVDTESAGRLTVGSDSRITKSGYFLRKYKIDELPQLLDVLIGKMSLVGPRPEVQEFIEEYPVDVRNKILSVRPGITDLASIEMVDENDILAGYEDARQAYIDEILPIKQKYYLEYVDNQSLGLDIRIIFLTIKKIVSR
ncbi:putative sugar transferase EpsL [Hydrogenovibrio crunogenus]|uniref:Putative sugar transferase EpsL n=1 Tax=Hydrogenovibrio crunogenus TaxID=39765 RepID=A0A4P7P1I6_9GAMM|nr:sugar transferase [Hydrogenovibrio crunogenus]QBZ83705.1 putative sugar transferase EpsL [Hydrogenovibrio crunogenus]